LFSVSTNSAITCDSVYYMVLLLCYGHCESSPGLPDECRTVLKLNGCRHSDLADRLRPWVCL